MYSLKPKTILIVYIIIISLYVKISHFKVCFKGIHVYNLLVICSDTAYVERELKTVVIHVNLSQYDWLYKERHVLYLIVSAVYKMI